MKKLLLSIIAIAMSVVTFAQNWEGTQFEISAGSGCKMDEPANAERVVKMLGQYGSITPSIRSFSSDDYKSVVVKFKDPLEYYYNVPFKDKDGAQQWNASSTNGPGATQFLIDIDQLHSISELFIQNVQEGDNNPNSFTITEAYAEKQNGEKEYLTFSAGWNAQIMVKGVKSGNTTFNSQWSGVNISDDIIGKVGVKKLRLYTNSDISNAPIQWCVTTTSGANGWPQINKETGESTIGLTLGSIYLQWTSATAGSIDIAAITWELLPFSTTLNESGYATFSAPADLAIKTDGVKAYKASVEGETITLTELNGYIPAGTGVILYGESNQYVEFEEAPVTVGPASNLEDNALQATSNQDTESIKQPQGTIWALGSSNGFRKYENENPWLPSYRAFIVHELASGAKMNMVFADEATDITKISTVNNNRKIIENNQVVIVKNGVKYNVSGQQVK